MASLQAPGPGRCAVLPPIVASGTGPDVAGPVALALCGPALLSLVGRPSRVVVVQKDRILAENMLHGGSDPTGCLRFNLPLHRVRQGTVNLHVLLQGPDRPVLVHTAHLLAFPADAAAEVAGLFDTMTTEVARFFQAAVDVGDAGGGLLSMRLAQFSGSAVGTWASAAGVAGAPWPPRTPAADPAACYAYDHFFLPFLQSWAALLEDRGNSAAGPSSTKPTGSGTAGGQSATDAGEGSSTAATTVDPELLNIYRRMLDYLLDHELFSCMVLLMNLQPGLQQAVITAGLDVPDHDDLQQLLPALARASQLSGSRSPRSLSSGSGGEEEGSTVDGRSSVLLRRLQARAAAAAAAAPPPAPPSSLEGPERPAAVVVVPAPVLVGTPRSASGCLQYAAAFAGAAASPPSPQLAPVEVAVEAQSPEQRQQLLEAELERLEARFTGELPLIRVRGRPAEANSRPLPPSLRQSEVQQQWQEQQEEQAPAATSADGSLHGNKLRHRQQQRRPSSQETCKDTHGGSSTAATTAAAKVVGWDDGGWPQAADWGNGSPQPACAATCSAPNCASPQASAMHTAPPAARGAAVRGALLGFEDPATEALYVTFKSHYSSTVDMSALLYSFGTWLTCTRRSISEPIQLLVLITYCIAYFFPYAFMLLARGTFLRHREAMLVAARSCSALIIAAVAAFAPPGWLPAAWAMAVARTVTLHISHGILLPACQQVRPRAALTMHAAHFLCDGAMLGTVLPPNVAAAHSLAIQVNGLIITSLLDVRARSVFLERFHSVLRGANAGAAAAAPSAVTGGVQPLAAHPKAL